MEKPGTVKIHPLLFIDIIHLLDRFKEEAARVTMKGNSSYPPLQWLHRRELSDAYIERFGDSPSYHRMIA